MTHANKKRTWLGLAGLLVFAATIAAGIYGTTANLFDQFGWFDEVLHAVTYFAVAIMVAALLDGRRLTNTATHKLLFVVTVTLFTLGVGAVWEIGEWLWDRWATPPNTILGKTDTMLDLVIDTGGAFLGSLLSVAVLAPLARRDRAVIDSERGPDDEVQIDRRATA